MLRARLPSVLRAALIALNFDCPLPWVAGIRDFLPRAVLSTPLHSCMLDTVTGIPHAVSRAPLLPLLRKQPRAVTLLHARLPNVERAVRCCTRVYRMLSGRCYSCCISTAGYPGWTDNSVSGWNPLRARAHYRMSYA